MKNGYQHVVLDDFVDKLRIMHKERTARLEALKTKEDALAYRDYVRGVVATAFGPFPERVPLDSVVLYCSNNLKKYANGKYKKQIGTFIRCEYEGIEGYILAKYLVPAPECEPVETKQNNKKFSQSIFFT